MRFFAFTLALLTLPLATFWICAYKIPAFEGLTTLAGALAAAVANVVLLVYLGIIMFEDTKERKTEALKKEEKKTQ